MHCTPAKGTQTNQNVVAHHGACAVVTHGVMIVALVPGTCREPVLVVGDVFEVRVREEPMVEVVGGVGLAAALLDGDVDEVHPAGNPVRLLLEAAGHDGLLVYVVNTEIELDQLDEAAGAERLGHFVDQALVIPDLRLP